MSKKRIIIIVVAVIVVIGVIGAIAGGGSGNDENSAQDSSQAVTQESSAAEESITEEESSAAEEPSATESSTEENSEDGADSTPLAVGDVIETSEWRLTIDDIQITPTVEHDGYSSDAEEGKTFVIVCFTLENIKDTEDVFNMFYLDAYEDGFQIDFTYLLGDVGDYTMIGDTLQPGRFARNFLAYEVAEDFQNLEISYSPFTGEDIKMLIVNE